MWEEAYLECSGHNSTSVAGGLQVGERGMLFITFCLGTGGEVVDQDGEKPSLWPTYKGLEAVSQHTCLV